VIVVTVQILPGEKFGALALLRASKGNVGAPLNLGGGLWVLNTPPVDVGTMWREWIGTVHADRVARADLWFFAKRPSMTPEVLDQENEDLKDEVWHLFLGLLFLGTPAYDGGYILTGAHTDGYSRIRQYAEICQYRFSWESRPLTVGQQEIHTGVQVKQGIRAAYGSPDHTQVKRGIRVFLDGQKEDAGMPRLHQFVRAVEAVVKPRPPGIKAKMVSRCRTFTGGTAAADQVVGECYELRSKEEHLLDWQDALLNYAPALRKAIMFRRVRQSEALARHVYFRVLTSQVHFQHFADAGIDAFWRRPEPQRAAQWGAPLDIVAVP
jgi:hypothetical protein